MHVFNGLGGVVFDFIRDANRPDVTTVDGHGHGGVAWY
jgi:hypothetical protein